MSPFLEYRDRSAYKKKMNSLIHFGARRTAVLTIDMQRDYLDMEVASKPVASDDAKRVLSASARLLTSARAIRVPVIHVYTTRRAAELTASFDGSIYGRLSRIHGLSQNQSRGVPTVPDRPEGSIRSEVPAELVEEGDIHISSKKTMDSFLGTDLDFLLRRALGVDTLLLTGVNTETCVLSTTLSAANLGYRPVVVADCVASSRGKDHHAMALELLPRTVAWVMTIDEVLSRLAGTDPEQSTRSFGDSRT